MNPENTASLQRLLDRLREGDRQARRDFLDQTCQRLRQLTAKILFGSFPNLGARHDVDSVVHETWLRLVQAMEKADPPTVADFFRLAAHKIRQVLLDMAERQQRLDRREMLLARSAGQSAQRPEAASETYDAARLAQWTEFHKKVNQLAEAERTVFEMHYYLGLPQQEIAQVLGLHPRKVSYLWIAATEALAEQLALMETS